MSMRQLLGNGLDLTKIGTRVGVATPNTLLNNLYAAFHFDSGTISFPADFGSFTLTPSASTTVSDGKINKAVNKESTIRLADSVAADFTFAGGIFTFSILLKFSSLPGAQDDVISKAGVSTGYILRVTSAGTVSFSTGTGAGYNTVTWGANISAVQWYQIICGRDASNVYLQVNSESVLGTVASVVAGVFVSEGVIGLLMPKDIPGGTYQMDELLAWDGRFLNLTDRTALWNLGAMLAYPFDP